VQRTETNKLTTRISSCRNTPKS